MNEKKDKQLTVKDCGPSIIVTKNITTMKFLGVTFDLKTWSYKPFRKPNDELIYLNIDSSHPPSVLKQLLESIGKRLSEISSSEKIFNKSRIFHIMKNLKKKMVLLTSYSTSPVKKKKNWKATRRNVVVKSYGSIYLFRKTIRLMLVNNFES